MSRLVRASWIEIRLCHESALTILVEARKSFVDRNFLAYCEEK